MTNKIKIALLFLAFLLILPASGAVKFKDVPADHWSAKAVYDLVRLGITNGYPDGTFRGNKTITRYETAIFLSKVVDKMGGADLAQIKSDLTELKKDIANMKKSGSAAISGDFMMTTQLANLFAKNAGVLGHGPFAGYRLKTTLHQDLGNGSDLKINFDTMDAGFYGATRDVVTQMIDVKGTIKINPVDVGLADAGFSSPINLVMTMGPGPLQHTDYTGLLPSETGYTFERNYSGLGLGTTVVGLDVAVAYLQLSKTNSGQSEADMIEGRLNYSFQNVPYLNRLACELVGDYVYKHPTTLGTRDSRLKINLTADVTPRTKLEGMLGFANFNSTRGIMLKAGINLSDLWGMGSTFKLSLSRIGSEYILTSFATEEFNFAGYDEFMRPLEVSTANVDGEFIHCLTEKLSFKGKASIRLSSEYGYGADKEKSRATGQAGFAYNFTPAAILDVVYRIEQDPTIGRTSDMAALGLLCRF